MAARRKSRLVWETLMTGGVYKLTRQSDRLMPLYGYARVSTLDQDLTIHRKGPNAAGLRDLAGAARE